MGAVLWSGRRGVGWVPGVSGHGGAQDVHDVAAVLAGGVGVAADVEAVLGDGLAGEPPGDLLLGLDGADGARADVVRGPDPGVLAEPGHVAGAVPAEFEQVTAGALGGGVLRPGDAGDAGRPGEDG